VLSGEKKMETMPQGQRLRTWLLCSLALHSLFALFLATRKMLMNHQQFPEIIFMPPAASQAPLQSAAQQPPAFPVVQQNPPPPAQQQQPTQEEVDFFLDLHKKSKFGYGAQVKLGDEPGGDESTEPAEVETKSADPVGTEQEPVMDAAGAQDASAQQSSEVTPATPAPAPQLPPPTDMEGITQANEAEHPAPPVVEQEPEQGTKPVAPEANQAIAISPTRLNQGTSRGGSPGPKTKLARLFEGFLDYMSDPKREEIIDYHAPDKRYADYMRKVGWALQNSFYLHNRPLTIDHELHVQVTLVMEIGRDGTLRNLSMTPQTDAEMLNKHIIKIINKAAPFARLPDDFKRTHMKIKMPVYIDAQQGTHTYYLQF
jgi:hypothetical protein